jgi:putative spermidine/putrescine transport system ATP-binding protein
MTVGAHSQTPTAVATIGRASDGAPVSFAGVERRFGSTTALAGLTLDIAPGELVALLGPSGCGKTTALRILAGFETADNGSVTVDGRDVGKIPAQRRDIGMVFQSYSLFPNMTAVANVAYGLRLRKQRPAQRNARALELLDMVGLSDHANRYPHQLSGGQQQRVALARALAIEPRVLLLDEPLSALDAKVRLQLREQIRALQQRLGTTALFVTHDQEEALSMADRVGVMRDGRLEQVATPTQLYAAPETAFVAEFVGTINRIPGRITGAGRLEVLGQTLGHQGPSRPLGAIDVLVRPEALTLRTGPAGAGIVTATTFLGSVTRVSVLLSDEVEIRVDVRSAEAAPFTAGSAVDVGIDAETNVLVDDARA